jgi:SAM-dependent methyltransferase
MFFPERIKSIETGARVLEVGPGGSPYCRSDVLLEKRFANENEAEGQRGYAKPMVSEKEVVYFDGGRFPFDDNAFDYVICSHVLEHVPAEEVPFFLNELSRVAHRGYLEFPTTYYDYIYNFPEHVTLLLYRHGRVNYIGKEECGLNAFAAVHRLFYESLKAGREGIVQELKQHFFQGFEWAEGIACQKAASIEGVAWEPSEIHFAANKSSSNRHRSLAHRLLRWVK